MHTPNENKIQTFNSILVALYLIFITVAAVYVYKRPAYNWDMMGYMGLIISAGEKDPAEIHRRVYREAKQQTPPHVYAMLTNTSHHFIKKVTHNPAAFYTILPYYSVKPLYAGVVYTLYKAGVPLVKATALPSVICYWLAGIFVFYWLRRYLRLPLAFLTGALLMTSAPVIETAKLSTPDLLSALLLLAGCYYILEKKRDKFACLFLLLAVFTRLDNVITVCCIMLFMIVVNKRQAGINAYRPGAIMMACLVAAYFCTTYFATLFGWNILFINDFYSQYLGLFYSNRYTGGIANVVILHHSAVMTAMLHGYLFIFIAFIPLLFIQAAPVNRKTLTADQLLALFLLIAIALRALVYTDMTDRFFVAFYIVFSLLLVRKICGLVAK